MASTQLWKSYSDTEIEKILNEKRHVVLMGIGIMNYWRYRKNNKSGEHRYKEGLNFKLNYSFEDTWFSLKLKEGFKLSPVNHKNYAEMYNEINKVHFAYSVRYETYDPNQKYDNRAAGTFKNTVSDINGGNADSFEKTTLKNFPHCLALYCGYLNYKEFSERNFPINGANKHSTYPPDIDLETFTEQIIGGLEELEREGKKKISYRLLLNLLSSAEFNVDGMLNIAETTIKDKFIPTSKNQFLELNQKNLEIKVITTNLVWIWSHINEIIAASDTNDSHFKIIVVDGDDLVSSTIDNIEGFLEDHETNKTKGGQKTVPKSKLEVLNLMDQNLTFYSKNMEAVDKTKEIIKTIKTEKNDRDFSSMRHVFDELIDINKTSFIFPFDIIVYSKISKDLVADKHHRYIHGGRKPGESSMVILRPINSDEKEDLAENNFDICVSMRSAIKIDRWFDTVWELFKKLEITKN